jgi:Tfp pilus assembly protein PilF
LKLAKAYLQLGVYEDAETLIHDILDVNAEYMEAKTTLGLCYYRQHKFGDAKKEWQEVLSKDPLNIKARSYLNMLKEKQDG